MLFAARWHFVPLIGLAIGAAGLPGLLTSFLLVSCLIHLTAAIRSRSQPLHLLDAGNMFGLSSLIRQPLLEAGVGGGIQGQVAAGEAMAQWSRWILVVFVKLPLVWLKTSALALEYDSLTTFGRASLITAIALGWYGIAPQLLDMLRLFQHVHGICGIRALLRGNEHGYPHYLVPGLKGRILAFLALAAAIFCMLTILGIHFVGIFACPEHDLSIIKGCTNMPNMTNTSMDQVNAD